ncbi:hypothetical protein Pcaca03_11980 [Pectobacterium carotovorum subsp. carotovorum]|uniref:Uncharacterized protein n=1 Tax=Pectobacterium carotovorum subsp. carotovorum TaxID=555 RepID=A0AAI9L0C0_PECCC|nr:hypothetical protein SOASR016_12260 [Pectobacterium carotovorum subsp. carotovorum]GLV68754.1 hypothetical protein Pcaca03_11980 [Pectobacterium carotovorum subsp. carotovorum]
MMKTGVIDAQTIFYQIFYQGHVFSAQSRFFNTYITPSHAALRADDRTGARADLRPSSPL